MRLRELLPVLRNRNFARFIMGRVCISLGWQMLEVAVGWQIYALTHDPLALGLLGLAEFLPFFSLVLIGGHTADHVNRRAILVFTAAVEAVCALLLVLLTLHGGARTWPIYATVVVFGGMRAFWAPALQAFLVNIVSRADFAPAVAMDTLLRQIATISGPAIGGLLYLLGAGVVYGACGALFLCTALLLGSLRVKLPPSLRSDAPLAERGHELLEGLHHVFRNRVVLACLSLDLFAVLFGGAVALLPIFAADILNTGPAGLGVLRSAPAVGAAVVGAALAARPLRLHAGEWMFGGVVIFGVATIVFALSTQFWLSLLALIATGAGDMLSVYVRSVLVQLNTPENIRGRVSAVNSMFIGTSNELGGFESGVVARLIGTVPSVALGGVLTLLVVTVWYQRFPQMRRLPPLH